MVFVIISVGLRSIMGAIPKLKKYGRQGIVVLIPKNQKKSWQKKLGRGGWLGFRPLPKKFQFPHPPLKSKKKQGAKKKIVFFIGDRRRTDSVKMLIF